MEVADFAGSVLEGFGDDKGAAFPHRWLPDAVAVSRALDLDGGKDEIAGLVRD